MLKRVRYPVKLISLELVVSVAAALLVHWLVPSVGSKLNYELFGQTIVTLNSGIIIAIFLALFHSSNEGIDNFIVLAGLCGASAQA